jgi:hypothetical protein
MLNTLLSSLTELWRCSHTTVTTSSANYSFSAMPKGTGYGGDYADNTHILINKKVRPVAWSFCLCNFCRLSNRKNTISRRFFA